MKINEIKSMTVGELTSKLSELKAKLFGLRFEHAAGNLQNNMQLNTIKKDIARVKTILRERELKEGGNNGAK